MQRSMQSYCCGLLFGHALICVVQMLVYVCVLLFGPDMHACMFTVAHGGLGYTLKASARQFQLTACVAECYRASCVHVVNVCMYDSSYFPNSTIGIHASLPMVEFTMHFLVEVEEDLPLSNAHDHDIV